MSIQLINPTKNNVDHTTSQEILIQIKNIEKWLLEQNLLNDQNLLSSLMTNHNYSLISPQCTIVAPNSRNLKITTELQKKQSTEIPTFIENTQNVDVTILSISDQEEQILIKDINQQIIQSFKNKNKIHVAYDYKFKLIQKNINNYLQRNILLEEKIKREQQKNKEKFLFKNQTLMKIIQKKKDHIHTLFYNQNVLLNKQIKQISLKNQIDLKKIENIYYQNVQIIKDKKNKNEQLISQKIIKMNNILQQKLNQHNYILEQEQIKFLQNEKFLKEKTFLLFQKKKLQMFFVFDFVEPNHKKKFFLLLNNIQIKNILHLKNLHIWRKKYIEIKLTYNQKINWQLSEDQKLKSNILNLQMEKIFFCYTKEQEIINIQHKQQMQNLQEQFKSLEINKKYKIMKLELEEEQQKNQNNAFQLKRQFQIESQLYELCYNKYKFILEQEQIQKQALIKKQLKIKKIKLKQELLQEIIDFCQQLIVLKNKLTKSKYEKQQKIKKQQNILAFHKQNLSKKTEEIQTTIQSNILLYYQQLISYTEELIKIINYLMQQNRMQVKMMHIFEKKIIDIFVSKHVDNHLNYFSEDIFTSLQQLIQNFMDNFQEKQFYYHFLLQKKYFLLEDFILQQKINRHLIILKYYDQKMTLINNQLHKIKLKYNHNNSQIFLELEDKIKKYEKFYTYLKKELFELQKKHIKQKQPYNQKIKKLKRQQNNMLQYHNKLQIKISHVYSNIRNYQNKSNHYLNKFYLWFWKKKLLSYWSAMCNNFILNVKQIELQNYRVFNQVEKIYNDNTVHQQKFLQQQTQKIITWNFDNFLSIIEQMHIFDIKNIITFYKETENQLHMEIKDIRQKINHKVQYTNYKNNLIEANLNDAFESLKTELKHKINYKKIQKTQQINQLMIQFNQQQKLIQNIHNAIEKQKQILIFKYKQDNKMISFFLQNIYLKYTKNYLGLIKQIKQKNKNINGQIHYINFKHRLKMHIAKISLFLKLQNEQRKLYYKHFGNIKKLKKNIKDQIFWYKQFYFS